MKIKTISCYVLFAFFCFPFLKSNAQIIKTIAGNGVSGFSGDGGQATAAQISGPNGVIDASGNLYIADYGNNRVRKINSSGVMSTLAGNGIGSYSGDGGQATAAEVSGPTGVAVDATGNVYIADENNSRIREVNTSGIISTIAGNGTASYSGDGGQGTAAEINRAFGVAIDAAGNVFIADWYNYRIRKVNTSGIISTIAGNGIAGFSGDGGVATAAELSSAAGLSVDASENIYVSDFSNNRVRLINSSGIISTYAGNGVTGFSGDGGPATAAAINGPTGAAIDNWGNLYIADRNNNRVRSVNSSGVITTLVGNGINGFSGDGGPSTAAEMSNTNGVAVDASGNVYVSDTYNNYRIREVTNIPNGMGAINVLDNQVTVYPNPFSQNVTVDVSYSGPVIINLFNMVGENVGEWTINKGHNVISTGNIPTGVYFLQLKTKEGVLNKKLIKVN
jgi:hypothetical protein